MHLVLGRSITAALLTILLDQGSKWLAASKGLVVVNPGAALSLGSGSQLVIGASVVALGVLFLAWPRMPRADKVFLTFILAAGFSNLADRLTFGGVRDFIALPGALSWFPTFNVADLILSVAIGWILLLTLFRPPHHPQ